jgi:N-acetylglucosaminyldiphosphoundecaprenol N-acetyl-beta-D-mannosaminyltransferase
VESCSIIGTPLAVTDYAGAVAQAQAWASERDLPYCIAAANTHVVTLARRDPPFREALGKFDLILPDGMPLVWVMNRKLKKPLEDRVYGPTFMLRCLQATQGEQWKHLLVGGTDELLSHLREKLLVQFPKLQLTESYAPPFGNWSAEDDARILEHIHNSGAHFVWIGLGCPKQELWLARYKEQLPPGVYSAVGAAFAFHAGRVRQAPTWMQDRGLEWLFRLSTEPRRLWRRYFVYNSLFLTYLLRDVFTWR